MEKSGFEFTGDWRDGDEKILSDDALHFLRELVDNFAGRRQQLLEARRAWYAQVDSGVLPDFRADTKSIRESEWRVGELPIALKDRRTEITGPVDRKMVINALNADVKVFMADFEDALSPTWRNVVEGQQNLYDAIRRTITYTDPNSGKYYELNPDPAILMTRVRGLHLDEKHIKRDGAFIPGALVDFGLYFYHNWQALLDLGHGPYFYVPKLEHAEEARWWNDVFSFAQEKVGIPTGTIKATMLIETLPAVFEMDEILFELKNHAAALNCGRWDYIFSYIKTLKSHPDRVLPDRTDVTMSQPFLDAYSRLLVKICHNRGALAMGGMSAFIPGKSETENNAVFEKVRADKQREADNGHDGSWVAHPGLAAIVNDVYGATFEVGNVNQSQILRFEDAPVLAEHLLAPCVGVHTDEGVRHNIRVALQYIEAWLQGHGAVAIYGLMEDAATAEISRASIWQWIRNAIPLDNGEVMTAEYFKRALSEEVGVVKTEIGDARWASGRFDEAIHLLESLCLEEDFAEFLTLRAYEKL